MNHKITKLSLVPCLLMLWASMAVGQNVNTERWIKLSVVKGQDIRLALQGDADLDETDVLVVNGEEEESLVLLPTWTTHFYTALADTLLIYGNVGMLDCYANLPNITAIDASHNTGLTRLDCEYNAITSLNVRGCTEMTLLRCFENELTTLDVSGCKSMQGIWCYDNALTSLNVTGCESLINMIVSENQLDDCALDSVFGQLPMKSPGENYDICIKNGSATNPGTNSCRDTIATNKNWRVVDYNFGNPVPIVNEVYGCEVTSVGEVSEDAAHAIRFFPNPMTEELHVDCGAEATQITIYDVYGRCVMRLENATDNVALDVSSLAAGTYFLRIESEGDSKTCKVVK